MEYRKILFMLLAATLFVVGCSDDKEEEPVEEKVTYVTPEAVLMVQNVGGEAKYALSYIAYSDSSIVSAVASTDDGNITLTIDGENDKQFKYIPQLDEYTSEQPENGNIDFEVTIEDASKDSGHSLQLEKDTLESVVLEAFEFEDETIFEDGRLKVYWDSLGMAQRYRVNIYDLDQNLIFRSKLLGIDARELGIHHDTRGWTSNDKAQANETYIVELLGLKYEEEFKTSSKAAYNVQCISFVRKEFVWAPEE